VVCSAALRDEGTSYHYAPPQPFAWPDPELTARLRAALPTAAHGPSWTTDAPYRETAEEIARYGAEGILTVEMEASCLFTVAAITGTVAAAAFVVSDMLHGEQWEPHFGSPGVLSGLWALFEAAESCLSSLPVQARDEQLDHAARVVARVAAPSGTQVADAVQEPEGIHVGTDLAGRHSSVEQLSADGHEAIEEIGVQRLEARVVGLQRRGEPVLGDQEVDKEIDPLRQRGVRCAAGRQQSGPGFGASVDLVAVDGDDQIRPGREVTVNRAHPDSGLGRDVAHRRLYARRDEDGGGGCQQGLLVAPGIGPFPRGPGPGLPLVAGRHAIASIKVC
jgi:Phosphorylase superfamily